ncbi:MAG: helicase C-terminal domain-containing protein [Anaerolineae bacterium]
MPSIPPLPGEFIALDIETTGLTPEADAIIEVGAVLARDGEIVAEFQTLLNPGRPIPPEITRLTHIDDEMVADQPSFARIASDLERFVGDRPIVGHNVGFDVGFLRQAGLFRRNTTIDTLELAAVLLPSEARYSLTNLRTVVGIRGDSAHRALDDATATMRLLFFLWERAVELPPPLVQEITSLARRTPQAASRWEALPIFELALDYHGIFAASAPYQIGEFPPDDATIPPLKEGAAPRPVSGSRVIELLGADGRLSKTLDAYEHRPQQIEMAERVNEALNDGRHALIEAGTGTGKSLAYLAPAALHALQNGERVVISTNTINLQEQLILKDIPRLARSLGEPLRAAMLKGRSNYLCPRRLDSTRRRGPNSLAELRVTAKLLVSLAQGGTADRTQLTLRGPDEHIAWSRLSAEDEGCSLDRCKTMMGATCPYYRARKDAERAHLLIVNHALLISDMTADGNVLPPFKRLIIDEAHQFEDALTSGLTFRADELLIRRRMGELGDTRRGLLSAVVAFARIHASDVEAARIADFTAMIGGALAELDAPLRRFFAAARGLSKAHQTGQMNEPLRITDAVRRQREFEAIETTWEALSPYLEVLTEKLSELGYVVGRLRADDREEVEDLALSVMSAGRTFGGVHRQLQALVVEPDSNAVFWITLGGEEQPVTLFSAPISVSGLAREGIWNQRESVVLTSATLQTSDGFEYLAGRLGAEHMETVAIGSPFDYHRSAMLYLPNDLPDPSDRIRYQRAVEGAIIELAAALNGRTMALFTSYAQLKQTANTIAPRLALGGITVLDQSDGTSRHAMLESFKTLDRAVLLGTRSFWEGVDIPGEALSALVIVRLPFAVPNEPIVAARSETYDDGFMHYSLPEAVLRFRQGFGRLIRTASDRGIVVVLDGRIISKRYGESFIAALPDPTVELRPMSELGTKARTWLTRP